MQKELYNVVSLEDTITCYVSSWQDSNFGFNLFQEKVDYITLCYDSLC